MGSASGTVLTTVIYIILRIRTPHQIYMRLNYQVFRLSLKLFSLRTIVSFFLISLNLGREFRYTIPIQEKLRDPGLLEIQRRFKLDSCLKLTISYSLIHPFLCLFISFAFKRRQSIGNIANSESSLRLCFPKNKDCGVYWLYVLLKAWGSLSLLSKQ